MLSTLCLWGALFVIIGPNIAFNQPVSQGVTVYKDTENRAVDGDASTASDARLWWSVKFDSEFVLTGIRIINSAYAGMCVFIHVGVRAFVIRIQKQSTTATLIKQSLAVLNMYHFYQSNSYDKFRSNATNKLLFFVCSKTIHT